MGQTTAFSKTPALLDVRKNGETQKEGCRCANMWGTYLHGLFESPAMREEFARAAGLRNYQPSKTSWKAHQQSIYERMADLIEAHLDLTLVWKYVET